MAKTLAVKDIKEEMIRGVEIVARKWRQNATDKSYHSVRVNVLLKYYSRTIEIIHVPMAQGGDRAYDKSAMIEWQKLFPNNSQAKSRFLSRYLEDRGVDITILKTDVKFKKDL